MPTWPSRRAAAAQYSTLNFPSSPLRGNWTGVAAALPVNGDLLQLDSADQVMVVPRSFNSGLNDVLHVDLGREPLDVEAGVNVSRQGSAEVAAVAASQLKLPPNRAAAYPTGDSRASSLAV